MKMKNDALIILLGVLFACAATATAQVASNPPYVLEQSVIASGGGQNSAGGNFSIDGTIGQAAAGDAVSGSPFAVSSGFWNYLTSVANALGLEADIASRPLGDSAFGAADLIQLRLFLNGGATPDTTANNEFQRADSAPYSTRGDGALCSNDLIQLRRYINGADAPQAAGGPSLPTGSCAAVQPSMMNDENGSQSDTEAKSEAVQADSAETPEVARELRVESPPATSGGQAVTVNIRVDALGDESAYSFRLNYNQTILTNPVINSGTTGAAIIDCATNVTNRIGCTVEAFPNNNPASSTTSIKEIGAGDNQLLLSITFTVAANAATQTVPLTLSNVSTSNDSAQNLTITSTSGSVAITGPTASTVSLSGRVMTATGRGIRNVRMILTDDRGNSRTAISIAFGYYRFDDVAVGATYILTANGKRVAFSEPTRVLTVTEEMTEINFVEAAENKVRDF